MMFILRDLFLRSINVKHDPQNTRYTEISRHEYNIDDGVPWDE